MLERQLIWKMIIKEGLIHSKNDKIKNFVRYFQKNSSACWDELINTFRKEYYDCFDEIVPKIANLDDISIQLALIRYADLTKPKELKLIKDLSNTFSPERNPLALKELIRLEIEEVNEVLLKRQFPYKTKNNIKEMLKNRKGKI